MARLWQGEAGRPDGPGETGENAVTSDSEHGTEEPVTGIGSASGQEPSAEGHAREDGPEPPAPGQEGNDGTSLPPGKKYLLIETNEEFVRSDFVSEAETASKFAHAGASLLSGTSLKPQETPKSVVELSREAVQRADWGSHFQVE
jgi:hypothetical protein